MAKASAAKLLGLDFPGTFQQHDLAQHLPGSGLAQMPGFGGENLLWLSLFTEPASRQILGAPGEKSYYVMAADETEIQESYRDLQGEGRRAACCRQGVQHVQMPRGE